MRLHRDVEQSDSVYLAACEHRDGVDECPLFGDFVSGKTFLRPPLDPWLGVDVSYHDGYKNLTPLWIGHADDFDLIERLIGAEDVGDSRREHVLPARDDHVVSPAQHDEPSPIVEVADISGAMATVPIGFTEVAR